MARLGDLARVLRSKNAGPFQVTVDIVFGDQETFRRVATSAVLTQQKVALLYNLPPEAVRITAVPALPALKITFNRPGPSSGAPGDRDVYGAQQHAPLIGLEIP